jgi:hypothetical protein
MNRNTFTKREIQILKSNPYTYRVTESQIFYTKEFKEEFWRRYQEGETPRKIVEELGYDPDMLGTARLSGLQINIKKQALRPGGFTEGKGRKKSLKSGMYSVDYNPSDETVVKMQHEIMYLRQEVEFLKKITSLKNTGK